VPRRVLIIAPSFGKASNFVVKPRLPGDPCILRSWERVRLQRLC
jgi:hypothetical protein